MKAYLILEDGTVFTGTSIGSQREVISEIVFNTSMTGYLEVLTDPSYAGQAVVMTYPLIDNYGICRQDMESLKPWPDGYIVRELSRIPSNFRCEDTIQNFLAENDIPGICGIDTRALTKLLREKGTMNGMITTKEYSDLSDPISRMKAYTVAGVVMATTTKEKYVLPGNGKKVALMDFGAKKNIARSLNERGCEVTVYPADTPAEEILAAAPDGIMLSMVLVIQRKILRSLKKSKKCMIQCTYFCYLSGTSADGAGKRYGYLQIKIRSQRWKSSGKRSGDRKSLYFFPEPWLRSRYQYCKARDRSSCIC